MFNRPTSITALPMEHRFKLPEQGAWVVANIASESKTIRGRLDFAKRVLVALFASRARDRAHTKQKRQIGANFPKAAFAWRQHQLLVNGAMLAPLTSAVRRSTRWRGWGAEGLGRRRARSGPGLKSKFVRAEGESGRRAPLVRRAEWSSRNAWPDSAETRQPVICVG